MKTVLFIIGWLLCGVPALILAAHIHPNKPMPLSVAGAILVDGPTALFIVGVAKGITLISDPCVINCEGLE
jgi:hypothetical protein